jgi:chemotaxis protein methyltransferase WspC
MNNGSAQRIEILNSISRLIENISGISVEFLGLTFEKIINKECSLLGVDSLEQYYQHLMLDKATINRLIEAIVVPETWFFREFHNLNTLISKAKDILSRRHLPQLRVLCIPAATGEEAYSIAMLFDLNKIPLEQVRIIGIDISENALAVAQIGEYRKNSFREKNTSHLLELFENRSDCFYVPERIKRSVSFVCENAFSISRKILGSFDIIICRNLLIYLDTDNQRKLLNNLSEMLLPNGVFCTSASESATVMLHDFFSLDHEHNVLFSPRQNKSEPECDYRLPEIKRVVATTTSSVNESPAKESSNDVIKLIDSGDLVNAEKLCLKLVVTKPDEPELFAVLGLIYEALAEIEKAESCYRKSLYLNPYHPETVIHLSYLLENRGQYVEAQRLRERLCQKS